MQAASNQIRREEELTSTRAHHSNVAVHLALFNVICHILKLRKGVLVAHLSYHDVNYEEAPITRHHTKILVRVPLHEHPLGVRGQTLDMLVEVNRFELLSVAVKQEKLVFGCFLAHKQDILLGQQSCKECHLQDLPMGPPLRAWA